MNAKLDTGRVFERIFQIYREQFTLLIPAALVLFIPVAILNGVVLTSGGVLAALIAAAIAIIATYWFQGMVVEAARDILDGRRDHTIGSLVQSAMPVIGPLLVAGILAGIGIAIGLILLIVPGLFLLTIWSMLIPVIVLEGRSAGEAFTRSREVVRGNGWSVFGLIIITFLLVAIASAIIRLVFTPLPRFLDIWLGSLVAHSLTVPFAAAALTTAYFKLVAQTEPASPAAVPTP